MRTGRVTEELLLEKRKMWEGPLTSSTVLPSSNSTEEPRISFTLGLRMTEPDSILNGRSSLITGI